MARPHRLTIYKDKRGEFRFRLDARNGQCIYSTEEGFKRYRTLLVRLREALSKHNLPVPQSWPNRGRKIVGRWIKHGRGMEFRWSCDMSNGEQRLYSTIFVPRRK